MRLRNGILIVQDGNDYVLVTTGEAGVDFKGMIKMNKTSAFIVNQLKEEFDAEKTVAKLLDNFEVSEDLARKSVESVIKVLIDNKLTIL